jgi:hypothetical protein
MALRHGVEVIYHANYADERALDALEAARERVFVGPALGLTYNLSQAMGQWGCTVTCLAMGLSALGSPMNPAEVCARLNETGGFTEDGLVIWGAVSEITDGDFEVEAPGLDYGAINTELAEGRPVIAKIILPEGIQHWVLIVGRDSGEYRALNPASEDATPMRLSEDAEDIKAIRLFVRR